MWYFYKYLHHTLHVLTTPAKAVRNHFIFPGQHLAGACTSPTGNTASNSLGDPRRESRSVGQDFILKRLLPRPNFEAPAAPRAQLQAPSQLLPLHTGRLKGAALGRFLFFCLFLGGCLFVCLLNTSIKYLY